MMNVDELTHATVFRQQFIGKFSQEYLNKTEFSLLFNVYIERFEKNIHADISLNLKWSRDKVRSRGHVHRVIRRNDFIETASKPA